MTSLSAQRSQRNSSAPFRNRLVISLLNRRQSLDPGSRGFTLIELMIVVAIVGILSAVALPNYLTARAAALIGARVGEAVGFAKECAVYTVTGIGTTPSPAAVDATNGGVAIGGCTGQSATGSVTATWGSAEAAGVRCLSQTSAADDSQAVISITADGALSCTFS